jgi:hypothetical protein
VWFDPVESARLAGTGLLALIEAMAAAQSLAHEPVRPSLACPRCRGALKAVHNRTRFGRSRQLECVAGHGAWQSFGEFLAEKGLLRPMGLADRHRAVTMPGADGQLGCVACGGRMDRDAPACPWCGSVPALVDVARLASALDPEAATATHPVHGHAASAGTMHCAACGAPQPPGGDWRCASCGATLAVPDLAGAVREVAVLGPALAAHAARPAPEVVRRRLEAHEPALERQRRRAAEMQAEAEARQRGIAGGFGHDDDDRPRLGALTPDHLAEWLADRLGVPKLVVSLGLGLAVFAGLAWLFGGG